MADDEELDDVAVEVGFPRHLADMRRRGSLQLDRLMIAAGNVSPDAFHLCLILILQGEDGAVEQVLLPHADEYEREGFYATSDLELRASETACKVPLRSLNDQAVWTLSTARPGNGIAELLETGVSISGLPLISYVQAHELVLTMTKVEHTNLSAAD